MAFYKVTFEEVVQADSLEEANAIVFAFEDPYFIVREVAADSLSEDDREWAITAREDREFS